MLELFNTTPSTGDIPSGGHAAVGSLVCQCLNDGYAAYRAGVEKRSVTGKELCQRHCSTWRKIHEVFAKRAFSMGFDQAEIDQRITDND